MKSIYNIPQADYLSSPISEGNANKSQSFLTGVADANHLGRTHAFAHLHNTGTLVPGCSHGQWYVCLLTFCVLRPPGGVFWRWYLGEKLPAGFLHMQENSYKLYQFLLCDHNERIFALLRLQYRHLNNRRTQTNKLSHVQSCSCTVHHILRTMGSERLNISAASQRSLLFAFPVSTICEQHFDVGFYWLLSEAARKFNIS